jgi:hypothetical protein
MHKNYMNKANRDAAWIAGGKRGHRSSIRGQLLHPMYVADYEQETGVVLTEADKGFGNTIYKTFFKVLYQLDDGRSW